MRPENNFVVRPATAEDIEYLEPIEKSAFQKFRNYLGVDTESDTLPSEIIAEAFSKNLIWMLFIQEIPVGFIVAQELDGNIHIEEFSISFKYQGLGRGRFFLENFIREAKEKSYPSITLTTDKYIPWNADFYSKFGFKEIVLGECAPQLQKALIKDKQKNDIPDNRIAMILCL